MAQIWNSAKLNPVFYKAGKFTNDQAPRYLKAPFDVVTIKGKVYLMPVSQCYTTQAIAQTSASDAEQAEMSRSGWYADLNPIVVGKQEMGSKDGDDWKSMHAFGWL